MNILDGSPEVKGKSCYHFILSRLPLPESTKPALYCGFQRSWSPPHPGHLPLSLPISSGLSSQRALGHQVCSGMLFSQIATGLHPYFLQISAAQAPSRRGSPRPVCGPYSPPRSLFPPAGVCRASQWPRQRICLCSLVDPEIHDCAGHVF